jgi:hypothetical protein
VNRPAEPRCALGARQRHDPLPATAGRADRLLLLEVNGPWGRNALHESRFDRYQAGRLADAAAAAGLRVQVIRRPGHRARTSAGRGPEAAEHSVAVADLRPGREAVHWRTWREPRELLDLDLRSPVTAAGPQDVALVCTHGRHDLCCAIEGRPVAAALAADSGWEVWETSHLGGDRFAANLLLLPEGDLVGGLDGPAAVEVARAYRGGLLLAPHHRGRLGRPAVEQAGLHHVMVALGEQRRGAVQVERITQLGERQWVLAVVHRGPGGAAVSYRVQLSATWSVPARLTCAAVTPSRVRRFHLDDLAALP